MEFGCHKDVDRLRRPTLILALAVWLASVSCQGGPEAKDQPQGDVQAYDHAPGKTALPAVHIKLTQEGLLVRSQEEQPIQITLGEVVQILDERTGYTSRLARRAEEERARRQRTEKERLAAQKKALLEQLRKAKGQGTILGTLATYSPRRPSRAESVLFSTELDLAASDVLQVLQPSVDTQNRPVVIT